MIIGIAIVLIVLVIVFLIIIIGNKKEEEMLAQSIVEEVGTDNKTGENLSENQGVLGEEETYMEHQILCKAKNQKEAQKIADKIGGQLVGYMEGVAIIAIEETVSELMERLEEEGLGDLELYPNLTYSTGTMEKKSGIQ